MKQYTKLEEALIEAAKDQMNNDSLLKFTTPKVKYFFYYNGIVNSAIIDRQTLQLLEITYPMGDGDKTIVL